MVRRSIAQDQLDWVRMKDYTWQAHSVEKHLDSHGRVESTKRETWETLMLDGQPYRVRWSGMASRSARKSSAVNRKSLLGRPAG